LKQEELNQKLQKELILKMAVNVQRRMEIIKDLFERGSNRRMEGLTINETYAIINQLGEGYNFIYGTFSVGNYWLQITGRDEYA